MNWREAYDEAPGYWYNTSPIIKMEGKATFAAQKRDVGMHSLVVSVAEQAITDYFSLVRAGVVREGVLIGRFREHVKSGKTRIKRYVIKGMTKTEATTLIEFLTNFERYADAAELKRDWSGIFGQILELERSGQYRRYLQIHESDDEKEGDENGDS